MKHLAVAIGLCFTMCADFVVGQSVPDATELTEPEVVESSDVIIPFRLTRFNNIVIEATLNGENKVDLMLHTAVSAVSLTEDGTKKADSVSMDEEAHVRSWGGNTTVRHSGSNRLQIGSLIWDDVSITEDRFSGRETDGKFGLNLFDGKIIALDFDASVLRVHSSLPAGWETYTEVPIEVMQGSMFLKVAIEVDGERIEHQMMVHSGYGGGVLLDDEFVAKHKLAERLKVADERELKDSFGNILKTKHGLLPKLEIGSSTFDEVPVGFFAGAIDKQRISIFGGDVFKRFNLLIDLKGEKLYLKENELAKSAWG